MYVIYLLGESIIITFLTLLIARSPKFCQYFNDFPQKYLMRNRLSNILLFKPKYPITKWFYVLMLTQYIAFFVTVVVCILYWLGIEYLTFINTNIALILYLIYFGICFIPSGIINSLMIEKYLFPKHN